MKEIMKWKLIFVAYLFVGMISAYLYGFFDGLTLSYSISSIFFSCSMISIIGILESCKRLLEVKKVR